MNDPTQAIWSALAPFQPLRIAPPVLQPAGLYLELAGEDIRARAFMAAGEGEDLCLRPDMTIPALRAALEAESLRAPCVLAYEGPVFRRQPVGSVKESEFTQVGAEWFADPSALDRAEVDVFATALEACRGAGVTARVSFGDVGLFAAVVDAAGLSPNWAERFKRAFARPGGVARLLSDAQAESPPPNPLGQALAALSPDQAGDVVKQMLDVTGVALIGGRTAADVAGRLRAQALAAAGPRPSAAQLELIASALKIEGAPAASFLDLAALAKRGANPPALEAAVHRADARWKNLIPAKPGDDTRFAVSFGRGLSYYDGFVFELEAPRLGERASLGGGGRYDQVLAQLARQMGREAPSWGAAGFALRPQRLKDAAR
jgi:ATP phosphoribosyltransferase regulatory subunit